jgi:hypothetical protein
MSPLAHKKKNNRTLLFGNTLKHGRHFDYRNQPLNTRMRTYYLDCYEAELCCYLVIHIGTLLRPLQLFYFHCDLRTDSPSYTLLRESIGYQGFPYGAERDLAQSITQRITSLVYS